MFKSRMRGRLRQCGEKRLFFGECQHVVGFSGQLWGREAVEAQFPPRVRFFAEFCTFQFFFSSSIFYGVPQAR